MSRHATGPRSDEGKERSSQNATRHGLRSERPVVPGEDAAAWDAFRAAIVADLGPANALERELAERVALQLWRLRRVARYEAEVVADDYEESLSGTAEALVGLDPDDAVWQTIARDQRDVSDREAGHACAQATRDDAAALPALADDAPVAEEMGFALLLLAGRTFQGVGPVPATAGGLRRALAAATGKPPAEAMALALAAAEEGLREEEAALAEARRRQRLHIERFARQGEARSRDRRLPRQAALDRVIRYEAHVSRQLNQARQMLREVQAERRAREEAARAEATAATISPGSFGSCDGTARPQAGPPGSFGSSQPQPVAADECDPNGRAEGGTGQPARPESEFVRSLPETATDADVSPCRCPRPDVNGRHVTGGA